MDREVADLPPPLVTELDIRAIEQRAKELPSARGVRRGYRVAQVDAFLGQAVAALRSRLGENEGLRAGVAPGNLWFGEAARAPRSPEEVVAQTFELVRSGYRMQDVDALLDEVTYRLTHLQAENEALLARNGSG